MPLRGIGERVRTLRRQRKLTQRQLGDHAQLYHTTISELERGVTHPSIETLERIANVLGVTTGYLLGEDPPGVHYTSGGGHKVK